MAQTIADSIQQGRPFPSLSTEVLIALLRTADLVGDVVRHELAADNLSMEQYNVLRILRGAGDTGLRTYEVVPRMVSRAPNITRLVDKLEEKGFLVRTRSRTDRRAIRLHVSRAGLELIDRLDGRVEAAGAEATRGLPAADLRTLVDLLDRLRDPLEKSLNGTNRHRSTAAGRRGTES